MQVRQQQQVGEADDVRQAAGELLVDLDDARDAAGGHGLERHALERVEGRRVHVLDVDLLDGTPLLDLKPYVPRFDDRVGARVGWFAGRLDRLGSTRSDGRFASGRGGDLGR